MDWEQKTKNLFGKEQEKLSFCLNKARKEREKVTTYYQIMRKRLHGLKQKIKRYMLKNDQKCGCNSVHESSKEQKELLYLSKYLQIIKQQLLVLQMNELNLTARIESLTKFFISVEKDQVNMAARKKYQEASLYLQRCDMDFPLFMFSEKMSLKEMRAR